MLKYQNGKRIARRLLVNKKSACTFVLMFACLSAGLMFSLAGYAQETGSFDELPAPSVVAFAAVGDAPVKRKLKKRKLPKAKNVDLNEVVNDPDEAVTAGNVSSPPPVAPQNDLVVVEEEADIGEQAAVVVQATLEEQAAVDEETVNQEPAASEEPTAVLKMKPKEVIAHEEEALDEDSKFILGMEVPPNTATRLNWTPESKVSGLAEQTPVLVVNGKSPGQTLCLTGAVHGDELNGIEMIRRIMYQLEPNKLTGTVIGVPVVNLMGFRRNSRYLPDRRDLNRFFPGNTRGSSASRIAHSFFTKIIRHCDALIDIHTGSLNRTNLTQLRADLSNKRVASLAKSFGPIAVLNSRGNPRSLRAAAVRVGIPTVTVEAGEPMRMQREVVAEGTKAIQTLIAKMGMYGRIQRKSSRYAPVYYKSSWVRANQSGIFFSNVPLGERVVEGEVLGTVTDPITNRRSEILSPYRGRILGMALDQVVLPGFAIYHIGIQTPEARLIEEGQLNEENPGEEGIDQDMETSVDGADDAAEMEAPLDDALDDDE
jgi:predicted deacylase